MKQIAWFDHLSIADVKTVGGKNASLGEMTRALKQHGIRVPDGFAITASGYFAFLEYNGLAATIAQEIHSFQKNKKRLPLVGKKIRSLIEQGAFPPELEEEIVQSYQTLCKRGHVKQIDVAVRSSATAEDLPDASFAGQQESFLHVQGVKALLQACRKCFASLFTDRAIVYREEKGFSHTETALSVGVQKMVRSDLGSAGVMFTLEPETGFPDMIVINSAFGLGENVVLGIIEPDQFMVFKPLLEKPGVVPLVEKMLGQKDKKRVYGKTGTKNVSLTPKEKKRFSLSESEVLQLAKWGVLIEKHYGKAMDIEWAQDGRTKELYIVQARPETVQSRKKGNVFKTYTLQESGQVLIEGLAIGQAIVTGKVQVIRSVSEIKKFKPGSILVTKMTSPDWVPIMKQAVGIITDHGGRTSHAAIVSRELGLPAIVGTQNGTTRLKEGQMVTLSCAKGEVGKVYQGALRIKEDEIDIDRLPKLKTHVMLNLASPQEALRWWHLPVKGVGLARMEFIINQQIKIHPMALVYPNKVKKASSRNEIAKITAAYQDKKEHFVETLALGIGKIAASVYPHPVIVRMSDFKTNEYANLIGGEAFEPKEENPMLGFRGACRYYSPRYRAGFALECQAIKRVREKMGFHNVLVMIPFCRTLEEADRVIGVLAEEGLHKGDKGLELYVMCEIPSNVILADEFAQRFDGFSIGSNDLTQLVLGVDRDSQELAPLFDENNEAVKRMIQQVIQVAKKCGKKIGICGQAPSDYPDFAAFLVEAGIDSISLNPDSVIQVIQRLSKGNAKTQKK